MTTTPFLGLEIVRAAIESNIWQTLTTAGLTPQQIVYDNAGETPPLPPYAVVSMSFNGLVADGMGACGPGELITGAMTVLIYTAKQQGAKEGEALATAVIRGWAELAAAKWGGAGVKVTPRSIEGPRTVMASQAGRQSERVRNAAVTVAAAAFSAEVA